MCDLAVPNISKSKNESKSQLYLMPIAIRERCA